MPILMQMYWESVTPEQYEKMSTESNFDTDTPRGAIFHTAAHDKKGMHIVDIWENETNFNSFIENKIMPIVKKYNIKGQPQVEIFNIHASFVPGYSKITQKVRQST